MRRIALAAGLALALAVPASAQRSATTVVKAAYNKELKATMLVDGAGRSLYLFTADNVSKNSVCTPDPSCRPIWPALKPPAKAGPGVKAALLGTTADGKQVTYNRHPLYYFAGSPGYGLPDKKPGQLNGQGFFGVWFVVSPKGAALKK
jgi:predicted lipoprotein with Yx(FWY)xxD motif